MPTAMDLLNNEVCDDILVVDLESRRIIIPETVTHLGVESDDSVRILHFQVPRHTCGVDLSTFAVRVNYKNTSGTGGSYDISDPTIEDDLIKFDWVVARPVTVRKGDVVFNVCFREITDDVVEREFNTTVATLPVLEGLETGNELVSEHTDVFEQLRESFAEEIGEFTEVAVGDYIANQSETLRGPKGDPFKYEDFTAEQLKEITGPTGASIKDITRTSGTGAPGTIDTYTVTLTDNTTTTFQVYNGADGNGAGDMQSLFYDPTGKATDIYKYVDDAIETTMPVATYDPTGKATDIFKYVDDRIPDDYVPVTRTINGKPLTSDITLNAKDLGVSGEDHTHSNYVPVTRTINGMPLTSDIVIDVESGGVGIESIEQTKTSSIDGGTNVITVILTDGTIKTFNIKNGNKGADATINGVAELTIEAGEGIKSVMRDNVLTISATGSTGQSPAVKLMTASSYDAVTDWTTALNEGEIAWRCE